MIFIERLLSTDLYSNGEEIFPCDDSGMKSCYLQDLETYLFVQVCTDLHKYGWWIFQLKITMISYKEITLFLNK